MQGIQLSTGLDGLDRVLKDLIAGDNIVWQVDDIDDYRAFLKPYCDFALKVGQPLIYFRFAKHEPLIDQDNGAFIHELEPAAGFERCTNVLEQCLLMHCSRAVAHAQVFRPGDRIRAVLPFMSRLIYSLAWLFTHNSRHIIT